MSGSSQTSIDSCLIRNQTHSTSSTRTHKFVSSYTLKVKPTQTRAKISVGFRHPAIYHRACLTRTALLDAYAAPLFVEMLVTLTTFEEAGAGEGDGEGDGDGGAEVGLPHDLAGVLGAEEAGVPQLLHKEMYTRMC